MAHYCKCMNVNIHLVVEKMLNINDVKVEYKEWMDEDVRDVLRNDLRLEVVKIGSSMTGVQFVCGFNGVHHQMKTRWI